LPKLRLVEMEPVERAMDGSQAGKTRNPLLC